MRILDLYARAIRRIMAKYGIAGAKERPSPSVLPNASFADVLQYTDWYATERGNEEEHYRFDRYYKVINESLKPKSARSRWAHIDVGCGAGLFSWAFLDWAARHGIGYSNITLYGYDACPQMIRLARMIRTKLRRNVPGYPLLHYHHNRSSFIRKLASSQIDSDSLITFGYVLAGSHETIDIRSFHRVVLAALDAVHGRRKVYLLSSDARSMWGASRSDEGWDMLLAALRSSGVKSRPLFLVGGSGDRCVLLSRKEEAQR